MLRMSFKILRNAVLIVGVLLTFFAVMEVIRAFHTLREFHPYAGHAFLAVLGERTGG